MAKVLVLYYSAYGHVEKMAEAIAGGAPGRRPCRHQARAGIVPEDIAVSHIISSTRQRRSQRSMTSQTTTPSSSAPARVSANVVADGQFPRPGRRTLGERSVARQSRRRIHSNATQHGGQETALLDHHQSSALRHGGRGPRLRPRRPDDARRNHRRFALRRHHDHGGAARDSPPRTSWRVPLSGPQDRGGFFAMVHGGNRSQAPSHVFSGGRDW